MFRILILEDDLKTVSQLIEGIAALEDKYISRGLLISVTVLSEYTQVERLAIEELRQFDVILLDRDCKIGGSFHVLPIEDLDTEKIIAISSTPPYNEEARQRGVSQIIHKDYSDLEGFVTKVMSYINEIIGKSLLL